MIAAAPGDVLAVPGGGTGGWLVRLGQELARKPSTEGHVVIVTHQDVKGRWIGIQGQPGGVALCDCTPFLSDSRISSNHAQPRPGSAALTIFLAGTVKSLGIAYDWAGIAEDAALVVAPDLAPDIARLWQWPSDKNLLPGHVVCSSLAAMLYDLPAVGWSHPDLGTERVCLPSDWDRWNRGQGWLNQPSQK